MCSRSHDTDVNRRSLVEIASVGSRQSAVGSRSRQSQSTIAVDSRQSTVVSRVASASASAVGSRRDSRRRSGCPRTRESTAAALTYFAGVRLLGPPSWRRQSSAWPWRVAGARQAAHLTPGSGSDRSIGRRSDCRLRLPTRTPDSDFRLRPPTRTADSDRRLGLPTADSRLGLPTRTADSDRRLGLPTETADCDSRPPTDDCRLSHFPFSRRSNSADWDERRPSRDETPGPIDEVARDSPDVIRSTVLPILWASIARFDKTKCPWFYV